MQEPAQTFLFAFFTEKLLVDMAELGLTEEIIPHFYAYDTPILRMSHDFNRQRSSSYF